MAEDETEKTSVAWTVPPAHLTERGEEVKAGLAEASAASAPPAHLTEQGEEAKEALATERDAPWPARPHGYLSPTAQATLKALRGH
jgi:hypothetical protein